MLVVPFPDASSQPNAMMVELEDAIVTYVAVSSSLWSENHARLTKLESVKLVLIHIKKVHSLCLGVNVQISFIYLCPCVYVEMLHFLCSVHFLTFEGIIPGSIVAVRVMNTKTSS